MSRNVHSLLVAIALCLNSGQSSQSAESREGQLPEEIRQAIKETTQSCPSKITFAKGFIERVNVLGNGKIDFLLNYFAVECGYDSPHFFCGSGGCTTQVFVHLDDGSYLKVLDDTVRNVTFTLEYGMPAMTIELHGSSCDKAPESCSETLYWNGMEFTPAH